MSARAITIWNGISQSSRDVIMRRYDNNTASLQEALNLYSWGVFVSIGWMWSDDERSLWHKVSNSSSISEIDGLVEPLHFTHAKNMWEALPTRVKMHMVDIASVPFEGNILGLSWQRLCFAYFSFASHEYMSDVYQVTTPADVTRIIDSVISVPAPAPTPAPTEPKKNKVVYDLMDRKGLIYQFCIDMAVTRNPETEEYIQQWIKQKEL